MTTRTRPTTSLPDGFWERFNAAFPVTQGPPDVSKAAPWDPGPVTQGPPDKTKPVTQDPLQDVPPVRTCLCGAKFRTHWNGRPRQYCSAACKQKAYRRRKRGQS